MSERLLDTQPSASSLSEAPEAQQSTLSELSPRDKPWDKHRSSADRVMTHYARSEFSDYALRVRDCSQLLEFLLAPDVDEGVLKLKLKTARFCRVRHCPVCQWRRSLMWKAKAYKVLPQVVDVYPSHRWLFLTLTVKNCQITDLRRTIQWMNRSWQKLAQRKAWPAVGWLRSMEVTRGKDGSAHPHFHCLLLVPPSYFGKGYIKQSEWCQLWQQSLGVSYQPIMHIKPVKQGHKPMELIPELLKYCVKESDLVSDREWFLELTRQLHKLRAVSTGGVLKAYLRDLEQEPDDLIGSDDDPDAIDEGSLWFAWKREYKQYRMVSY